MQTNQKLAMAISKFLNLGHIFLRSDLFDGYYLITLDSQMTKAFAFYRLQFLVQAEVVAVHKNKL